MIERFLRWWTRIGCACQHSPQLVHIRRDEHYKNGKELLLCRRDGCVGSPERCGDCAYHCICAIIA